MYVLQQRQKTGIYSLNIISITVVKRCPNTATLTFVYPLKLLNALTVPLVFLVLFTSILRPPEELS